jgi:multiple antibiotic resistance protein
MSWLGHLSLFLLGFSSLFPLINPVGTALIVNPYFANSTLAERKTLARTIVLYCFGLGMATLFLGGWALALMGISIPTTQMAGGIIIAKMGLDLLTEQAKADNAAVSVNVKNSLFYPVAFPLTLGPGGISALVTLGAHAHVGDGLNGATLFHLGLLGLSLVATLILTYFCFVYSQTVIRRIGQSGSLILNRLMAFLVFCVGIQMLVVGLGHSFPKLFS